MKNENEKRLYKISLCYKSVNKKPIKRSKEIATIHNNIQEAPALSIAEFSKFIQPPYSYTWSGALFNGKPSNENWISQQVIGIDFDNNKDIKIQESDVINRFQDFNIKPSLIYYTLSNSFESEWQKFRVVLFLNQPILEKDTHKLVCDGLKLLFPESDFQSFSLHRIFFGGNNLKLIEENPVDSLDLINAMAIMIQTNDGGRSRKIKEPLMRCSFLGVPLNTKYGEIRDNLYNTSSNTQILPKYSLEKIRIEDFRHKVKILDEFLNGTWLYHNELFGLATNLSMIKGGLKIMKETMMKYNNVGITQYNENNFNILSYTKLLDYPPIPINSFSKYSEDADIHDLAFEIANQRGKIKEIEKRNKISLAEAELILNNSINHRIQNGEIGKIYILKLPTGLGKTQVISKINGITIAANTNNLKNEIASRMKVEYLSTPDTLILESNINKSKYENYQRAGLYNKATSFLHQLANPFDLINIHLRDFGRVKNYLEKLENVCNTKKTILTTHSRAVNNEFCHETLVFDEDPLNSLLEIETLRISDLQMLKNSLPNDIEILNDVIETLLQSEMGKVHESPRSIPLCELETIIEYGSKFTYSSKLFTFFGCSHFYKDERNPDVISYIKSKTLPLSKKVIILSASISISTYKQMFGERVEFIDISDVEHVGQIDQYTKYSCSRESLNRCITTISKEVDNLPTITFREYAPSFKHPAPMWFGNCSGYDTLTGFDISVVGTPHLSMVIYLLYSALMGVKLTEIEYNTKWQKINYNGYEFMFQTFSNDTMRKIQLSMIEGELIQAVGRARALRKEVKVKLFSNFPLRISNKFIF